MSGLGTDSLLTTATREALPQATPRLRGIEHPAPTVPQT